MSATGRGKTREGFDYYPTPGWCVDRLIEARPSVVQAYSVLEPFAGDGAIIRALAPRLRCPARITAVEIQPRFHYDLTMSGAHSVHIADWFSSFSSEPRPIMHGRTYDLDISNPPYNRAMEAIKRGLMVASEVIMLLRLSFLASLARSDWMRTHAPDLYVLPDRPIFVDGQSDNCDYAWFAWKANSPIARIGEVHILKPTPREIRLNMGRI